VSGAAGHVTDVLTGFTVRTRYEDFEPDVLDDARKALLDTVGVTLAGMAEPATGMVLTASTAGAACQAGTQGSASILGTTYQCTPMQAALVNGYAAHALDYDDTQHRVGTHMSAPVVAAALAAGEAEHRCGADLLAAYIVGFEVGCRLGRAGKVARHLSKLGVHSTGFLGHLGAAAATSRLVGLDPAQTNQAFGIAAGQASGLVRSFGTMGKGFNAANAAADAVLSAQLARAGFTGPEDILDGKQNFFAICGAETDAAEIEDGLGEEFEITNNTLKAFACAGWRNPIIEAAIAITGEENVPADEVESIAVWAWEGVSHLPNYAEPTTGLEAKFSAQYAAAVALVDRAGGVVQFSDGRVADSALATLTRRATLGFDANLTQYQIRLEVSMTDGRRLSHFIPVQKGDHANPLSWDELLVKFRANAAAVLPADNIEELAERLRDVDHVTDVADIARLCRI
jgi:2-methylcitrate dehydratase PrpD